MSAENTLPEVQRALDRLRRANKRGSGCYLTADMVRELDLTFLAQIWEEETSR